MIDLSILSTIKNQSGVYKPATSLGNAIAGVQAFDAYKVGAFIHWGMTTFVDSTWWSRTDQPPPPVSTFTFSGGQSVFDTWGTQFASTGKIEYAILTVKHHYGFRLYPTNYEFNNGVQISGQDDYRTRNFPEILNYGVDNSALVGSVYQNIVGAFCDSMRANNIVPGLYYSLGHDLNLRGGPSNASGGFSISGGYDASGNFRDWYAEFKLNGFNAANAMFPSITGTWGVRYALYIDHVKQEMTYLIQTYNPGLIWFDITYGYPAGWLNDLYQHCKSVNPDIVLMANSAHIDTTNYYNGTSTNFPPLTFSSDYWVTMQNYEFPPLDVISDEMNSLASNLNEYLPSTNHNGISYYMPKEFLEKAYSGAYWNITGKGSLNTQQHIQDNYDLAKASGTRFCLNFSPDTDGVIEQGQIDLIGNLTL